MRFFAAALCLLALAAQAQQKEIKIGFIYDVTGPFAGGGSEPAQIGTKAAIDYFNEKGGVMGYKINAIFADAQSKVDVAINEMTRLYDQDKVDLVMGVYSSAQCVPMVQQIDSRKKFLWLNVCIATAVFKDKKLQYVFRPQAHSDQFGAWSCDYIAHYAKSKFGTEPKNSGGIFQIRRLGYDDAEFTFFGWSKDIRRRTSQKFEVRKGDNSDIRVAVVRRIIEIIRDYEQEDFSWNSQRLGRVLMLSARPSDNAGLEEFMMQEFFGTPRP